MRPARMRHRMQTHAAVLLPAMLLSAGCRERPEPAPAAVLSAVAILTPTRVVETLHALRTTGRLAELDSYVVPAERGYQVPVILAIDQVLAANAALQSDAAARFGSALAMGLDLAQIGDSYHVFSRRVRAV